ncbi:exosortase F system-associated membrane protein [Flavobacterium sp.]|jgi:exosortase F-associated protein|uniref:exosortase F system-associated membrane protein n=1 Tax=Flavobacterium sp. TaxID=239 RepID=UPI0037BEAF9B
MEKQLKNKGQILLIISSICALVFIRLFEDQLFYDPFLQFFKQDYKNKTLPNFEGVKLFLGILLRYSLNTIFSLAILYLLFKQKELVRFAMILYVVFFIGLLFAFFGLLYFSKQPDYLILFYIRRFIIQPLFLVLFIPAFYYQKLSK